MIAEAPVRGKDRGVLAFRRDILNEEGLTFIELLAVIVILSILSAIAFAGFTSVQENAKEDLCLTTREETEQRCEQSLTLQRNTHSATLFHLFLLESVDGIICPSDGIVTYANGEVICSVHSHEEENSGDVPFL